ncbi:MAG: hypothetical protein C4339_03040 [Nitrososphaerota archaeon]
MPLAAPLKRVKTKLLSLLLLNASSAQELSQKLRLNKTAVRRHLEEMTALSLLGYRFERRGRGRPRKVYYATPLGREFLFDAYPLLLAQLSEVLKKAGPGEATSLFSQLGAALAKEASRRGGGLEALKELGFISREERQDGTRAIITFNCPVLRVAQAHPELFCDALHSALLGTLLGTRARMRKTMALGAPACFHELSA